MALEDNKKYVIGRNKADIVIPGKKISRKHCSLTLKLDQLVLNDEGSRNGITIQGSPITTTNLKEGDYFCAGDFEITIKELERVEKTEIKVVKTPHRVPEKEFVFENSNGDQLRIEASSLRQPKPGYQNNHNKNYQLKKTKEKKNFFDLFTAKPLYVFAVLLIIGFIGFSMQEQISTKLDRSPANGHQEQQK